MADSPVRPPRTHVELAAVVAAARVDEAIFDLRPDYRVLLIAVDGLTPAPSDADSEQLLGDAEQHARQLVGTRPVETIEHVAAWRAAYRAFGAKPQRTRNSLEALLRRVEAGLPRVNRLTDVYNAISIRHAIPFGGEDLDHYVGAPRLLLATGDETFVTTASGVETIERPEPGEAVWCDGEGVTCRRWNWRQTTRTRLRDETSAALFVLDALDPVTEDELRAAADELVVHLTATSPALVSARRLISAPDGSPTPT